MAILPVITFVIVIATQFIMLLISTAVLLPSGLAGTTWHLSATWPRLTLILFYGLVTERSLGESAHLRLDTPGLQLGEARHLSLGSATLARDQCH